MDKRVASNVTVGIFVALGMVGFVYLLFSMGGSGKFLSSDYVLFAKFTHVKGLHSGSEVSLSGLRVGSIKEITISNEKSAELLVKLAISKSVQERIRKDSVASVRTQGVLGDKYIEISIGSPNFPVLRHGDQISSSELSDIFTKSGSLVEEISRQFHKGGNVDNLVASLNRVSQNLETLTSDVKANRGLLHSMFYGSAGDKLEKSMNHLEGILKKIEGGEGTLGALVNDPTIYEDVKSLLGGAKRSTVLKYFLRRYIDEGDKPVPPQK